MDAGTRKLRSEDGKIFEVDSDILEMSQFLKDMIIDYPERDQEITINKVDSKYLDMILKYLNHYKNIKPFTIPRPLPDGNLKNHLPEWDYQFISPLSLSETIDLINAANFLDIDQLVALGSARISAEMLLGTVEEVREKFIWGDLTEEDIKEYNLKIDNKEGEEEQEQEEDEKGDVKKEDEKENKIEDDKKENKIEDEKKDSKIEEDKKENKIEDDKKDNKIEDDKKDNKIEDDKKENKIEDDKKDNKIEDDKKESNN